MDYKQEHLLQSLFHDNRLAKIVRFDFEPAEILKKMLIDLMKNKHCSASHQEEHQCFVHHLLKYIVHSILFADRIMILPFQDQMFAALMQGWFLDRFLHNRIKWFVRKPFATRHKV